MLPALALAAALLSPSPARAVTVDEARRKVVDGTMRYLNTPYLWGGEHPDTGLDCSGFVQIVFRDAGLPLPRSASAQFAAARKVRPDQVEPGDLVFFSMKSPGGRSVDHIGIYVGKGLFVHASTTYGVHVESLARLYYQQRLVAVLKYPGF